MSARERLEAARAALAQAERGVGIRRSIPLSRGHTTSPVLHVQGVVELVDTAVQIVPFQGWIGFVSICDIGWEAAARKGLDLSRVLVVANPEEEMGRVCSLMLDALDVVCVGDGQLDSSQRRRLAAKARSEGAKIITLNRWNGLSRSSDLDMEVMRTAI